MQVTPEEDEEALNTIATTKSSGGRTCAQVMTQFLRGTETQAIAAASILRTLSGHEKAAGALGKEDTPFDRHFMDLFYFTKQDSVRGDIAFFCEYRRHQARLVPARLSSSLPVAANEEGRL